MALWCSLLLQVSKIRGLLVDVSVFVVIARRKACFLSRNLEETAGRDALHGQGMVTTRWCGFFGVPQRSCARSLLQRCKYGHVVVAQFGQNTKSCLNPRWTDHDWTCDACVLLEYRSASFVVYFGTGRTKAIWYTHNVNDTTCDACMLLEGYSAPYRETCSGCACDSYVLL